MEIVHRSILQNCVIINLLLLLAYRNHLKNLEK
jgi:hypothetical protein